VTRKPTTFLLLLPLLAGCAATAVPEPEPAPVPVDPPAEESLADLYARHVSEVVEQDIALGRIVVRMGDSIDAAGSSGELVLRERTFSRLADDVARVRGERLRIAEFWERVQEQWPRMATMEDRAALEALEATPVRE